jgi:ketosteroid isomerase-like protein
MSNRIAHGFAVLGTALALVAAAPADSPQVLVDAEARFAADAARLGTRGAFLIHLAESSVMFAPGPVSGRLLYESRKPNAGRLEWVPAHAELSSGGDMGWTTGPWSYRTDSASAEPGAWGHFTTVWKRLPGEGWKAVLDAGCGHAPMPLGGVTAEQRRLPAPPARRREPLAERRGLWLADEAFGRLTRDAGVDQALRAHAAGDVWVLRDGMRPVRGAAAADSIAAREGRAALASNAQFISEAGDLGYTYGTLVAAPADTSWYVHIWRRADAKRWELALQLRMEAVKR